MRRPLLASAKLVSLLLLTGAALGIARPAAAQTYKVTASGVITRGYDRDGVFNSSAAIGTPYTFSYLFDYSVPSTYSDPTAAQYDSPGANYGATAAFGDYKFTPSASGINYLYVGNSKTGYNGFNLVSEGETATGFGSPTTASVQVEGESSTGFFSSTAMPPLSAYNVANFDFLHFVVFVPGSTANGNILEGSVTSLSAQLVDPNVAPVPEASTTVSLGLMLGLGGLVLAVRRRKVASR